jgi:hypothetical protein
MTADGGLTSKGYWDQARVALGDVAQFFLDHTPHTPEELSDYLEGVANYNTIPADVRHTIEHLSPDEQIAIKKMFQSLAQNSFYLEGGPGGLRGY